MNSGVTEKSLLNRTAFNPDVDATFEENDKEEAETNEQASESCHKTGYQRQATAAAGALNSGVPDQSLLNRTAFNPDVDATFEENGVSDKSLLNRNAFNPDVDATFEGNDKEDVERNEQAAESSPRQDTNDRLPLQRGP